LPVTTGALQTTRGGGAQEGFLARLAPCAVTLGSTGSFFPKTAGSYNLSVFSSTGCAWSASTDVNWVTINSGGGSGNGQINYTVAANTGPLRVGHIAVSGQTYTIQQVTGICATPASTGSWHPANIGLYSFTVFATCPWTATTQNSWVSILTSSGNGNGTVNYFVLENTTGAARYGTIDLNGQTYAVNQVGGAGGGGGGAQDLQQPLRFSKTKPNVLIVFLDRFMGSYVEEILAARPELAQRLSGFTWYPRTVSAGENSIAGVHAMLGGYDYTPYAMNARHEPLVDLSTEAFSSTRAASASPWRETAVSSTCRG
jgi:hypothetical protein